MKNATRITVSAFGTLVGVAGFEHGIGEILQGNIAPSGWIFPSWPGEGPFSVLNGEPALTILPSVLIAGWLTVLASLIFVAWVIRFIESKHGSVVLALLSVAMLLVGGGVFPPVFGLILAVVATRIHSSDAQERKHPGSWRLVIAKAWPWSLGMGVFTWLLMMPGLPVLNTFGIAVGDTVIYLVIAGMIGFLLTSIFTGFVSDGVTQNAISLGSGARSQHATSVAFPSKG